MTVVLHSCVYRKPRPVTASANGLREPLRPVDMHVLNVTLHVAQSVTVGTLASAAARLAISRQFGRVSGQWPRSRCRPRGPNYKGAYEHAFAPAFSRSANSTAS